MTNWPAKKARVDYQDVPLDLTKKQPASSSSSSSAETCERVNPLPTNSSYYYHQLLTTIAIFSTFPDIPTKLLYLEYTLTKNLASIKFPAPIEYLYSPIEYACSVHLNYLRKFCNKTKKILFLGMNPGPWGMSQTGIPFGEIEAVKNWLMIDGIVNKPAREHCDRKISGFSCKRSEQSGKRFWNFFKKLCGTPENFFRHAFIRNYCPVALMDAGGRNITPAELKGTEQNLLIELCDRSLGEAIHLLRIEKVIAIGRFAEKRAKNVIKTFQLSTEVFWMPHPSPRSCTGTQNWSDKVHQIINELNIHSYLATNIANAADRPGPSFGE